MLAFKGTKRCPTQKIYISLKKIGSSDMFKIKQVNKEYLITVGSSRVYIKKSVVVILY